MEAIEISASSVEQAQDQAAAKFGVERDQITVTVIEETKGLFGKGQVRILAEVKAEKAAPAKKTAKPKKEAATQEAAEEPKPVKPVKKATKTAVVEVASEDQKEKADVVATQADADQIVELMSELLDSSGLKVKIKVSEIGGKYVNVALSGTDVSYLVGRRGEVLNALQYLTNVILTRQFENGVRVVVDGDDYRRRREEVLEKLALDIAEEVKKRGEEAVLDALPAFERRVIHQALSEFDGIVTYSEGEEPDRRVVIAPAEVA